MTKKISLLLVMLLCMNCIFTAASAYDSGWSHYKGPAAGEPVEAPTAEPIVETPVEEPISEPVVEESYDDGTIADGLRTSGADNQAEKSAEVPSPVINVPAPDNNVVPSPVFTGEGELRTRTITLDSVTLYGETDESTQAMLDLFSGTKISVATQEGSTPRTSVELSMQDSPLFTFDLQSGTPYYVSSNFLGTETYMIYSEDEFAENLVKAFYRMMEQVSDDTSNLPDQNEVLAVIKSIRNGSMGIIPSQLSSNINLTQDINPTALMGPVMDIMSRFVSAEPTENITYRYTDFDSETFEFEWPAEGMLPEITGSVSAMTAMFFGEDIIAFLDCLPQFLADNPELADALNQAAIQAMTQTNPGMEIPEGTDLLGELVKNLRESAKSLEDFYLNLKIDNNAYGSPVLITVEIGKPQDDVNTGLILTIMPVSSYPQTALEIAGDAFENDQSFPLFRALSNSEGGQSSLNFRYADPNNTTIEIASYQNAYENGDNQVKETTVYFDVSGVFGTVKAVKTSSPNRYGGMDVFTQVTYDQSMMGQPMFNANFTSEVTSSDPLPMLTPADAVHASDMTEADYDDLAGMIFLQLMMITMNFM